MADKKLMLKRVKKKKLQVKRVAHVKTETVASFPNVARIADLDLDK